MTGLIIRWFINALSLMAVAHFIKGITIAGFGAALVAIFILGIVNALIRPLILLLTLPLTLMTLGLFTFIVNGLMLYMVSSVVVGFEIQGFLAALMGTILMSVISAIVNGLIK